MPPSFVINFSALLLFGPHVAMLVATAGALTPGFLGARRASALRPMLVETVFVIVATQSGGLAYRALGGLSGDLMGAWQGLPIAAAVVAYQVAQGALAAVLLLVAKQPVDRTWPTRALRGCPMYLVGASVAVGLVEVIDHRMWKILPVAAGSLFFAYRMYVDYINRLEEGDHRREVIDFLDQGMSVVDADGRVTIWNDTLERILGCSRERALGQRLVHAVPVLGGTRLPQALKDTLADRTSRTLEDLRLPSGADARILCVKLLPVAGGVALLWHDVTERTHAERELKQSGERLALAAEGANDALWEWNLRTREFYASRRWRVMVGLPADTAIRSAEEWLNRVHADDLADLKAALEAHLTGHADVFQHEHRIRHEDGSYRRFLCRGLSVAQTRRRDRIAGSFTDTTEQSIAQEQLRSAGFNDPLTGLVNRGIYVDGLGRSVEEFKLRQVSNSFAVLYLDLDRL
jgi:PAS domain S-box-containing protein